MPWGILSAESLPGRRRPAQPGNEMRCLRAKTLTILLSATFMWQSAAWAARFVDTSGSWTEKYINRLSDKGIVPAETDGKFNPDKPVTRAQLAAWLVKVLGLDNQPVPSTSSFADVKPTDWFFKPVEIIRQNNYISGYADGFRPHQFIQRAEVMSIIARTLNSPAPDQTQINAELAKFKDGTKVPDWAKNGVAQDAAAGIIVNEKDPDSLNPTDIATRGDTIALLSKLDEYRGKKDVETAVVAPTNTAQTAPPPQQYQQPQYAPQQGSYPPPGYSQPQYTGQVTAQGMYPPPQPPPQQQAPPVYAQPPQQYQPAYAAAQPQSAPYGAPPNYAAPPNYLQGGLAVVAAGTKFRAQLKNTLDSGSTQPGEEVQATLGEPLYSNGAEVVPAGSRLIGNVTNVVSAKRFHAGANGKIDIKFTAIETPDGRKFPLQASVDGTQVHLSGGTTGGRVGKGLMTTAVGAGSGAALGTALGAIVGATSGGGHVGKSVAMGAVFGTALGGGVGAVGGVVRKGSEVKLTAGMPLPVQLDQAFQITAGMIPPGGGYRPPPQPYYGGGYGAPVQQPAGYYPPQPQQ